MLFVYLLLLPNIVVSLCVTIDTHEFSGLLGPICANRTVGTCPEPDPEYLRYGSACVQTSSGQYECQANKHDTFAAGIVIPIFAGASGVILCVICTVMYRSRESVEPYEDGSDMKTRKRVYRTYRSASIVV